MNKKTSETIIKIIAILGYIGSVMLVLFSIAIFFGGSRFLANFPMKIPGALITGTLILMGIMMLVLAVIEFFVARGLWNHKNWARIITIIGACFGILGGITSLPFGIFGLLINGAILYLFAFEKTTIKLFK